MHAGRFRVVPSRPEMADDLEAVQAASFPTIVRRELITATHYRKHLELFPEGQFAVVDTDTGEIVGCSTDFRTRVDFDDYQHRYMDAVVNNWLTNHDPEGEWMYGADIGVKPAFRGLGLSRLLYGARQDLARRLNLLGHVAGGMMVGYGQYKDDLSAEEYVRRVIDGEIFDATLSVQLRRGYHVHGIIHEYAHDPSCDDKAAFIVWRNPDHDPSKPVVRSEPPS
jgi:GNAT superfamily N-acetyltransferase